MIKGRMVSGAANSFHVVYLRENMIGQNFKGSKVTEVTNNYIKTIDGKFSKKGLTISFIETNPDAGGFNISRRR